MSVTQQAFCHHHGPQAPDHLCEHKAADIAQGNPGKAVGQAARQGHGGIGKGRRGRKPVRRHDVQGHGRWRALWAVLLGAEDHPQQAKGGHRLTEPLCHAGAGLRGVLQQRQVKHGMRGQHTRHRTDPERPLPETTQEPA